MSVQGGSNRRQPARSVRTTANRPSNYYAKPFGYRNAAPAPIENEPSTATPPGFFPAISFFTDAVSALPKEMQKHFTVLKETEGKLHQPDQAVTDLVNGINKLPEAPRAPAPNCAQAYMQLSLAASVSGSAAASVANGVAPGRPPMFPDTDSTTLSQDPHLAQREDYYRRLVSRLRDMTAALDEKNMILSAANDTLSRQLTRFDSAMPHIENEISEEARLGSNAHWALPHMKDFRRTNGVGTTDRGRREVNTVNNLAAAAAAVHEGEIAATRSEARREAMLAKRSRIRDVDSDQDERTSSRKHGANKVRKAADAAMENNPSSNGQAQKRRKIEKPAPAERSLGAALSGRLGGARNSPRGSPAPEASRKRTKPPPAPAASRKKPAANPSSIASSPTRGTFPTTSNPTQSPVRPQLAKARQQSLQNIRQEIARSRRPSSSSTTHKNGTAEEAPTSAPAQLVQDDTVVEEPALKANTAKEPSPVRSVQQQSVNGTSRRRESAVKSERPDLTELKQLPKAEEDPAPPVGRHSRAVSRSSKPATPLITAFAEMAPMIRSRSTRNGGKESNGILSPAVVPSSPKRSHKKGGNGSTTQAMESPAASSEEAEPPRPSRRSTMKSSGEGAVDNAGEEAEAEDENEPRYCTCNRVSFGDMIACDNDRCPTEWFHLECVELAKAPKGKVKWFCSDRCRREARNAGVVT